MAVLIQAFNFSCRHLGFEEKEKKYRPPPPPPKKNPAWSHDNFFLPIHTFPLFIFHLFHLGKQLL